MNKSTPMSVVPFHYHSNEIRTIQQEDGSVWFVVKDICDVLGYVNPRETIKSLDEDERVHPQFLTKWFQSQKRTNETDCFG